MEKEIEERLKPTILDPSFLCTVDFWEEATNLQRIFPAIYVPESIKQMENSEFVKFYGGNLSRERILSTKEVVKRSHEAFEFFLWQKHSEEIPQQFRVGFSNLRRGLEQSYIAESVQNALLDACIN